MPHTSETRKRGTQRDKEKKDSVAHLAINQQDKKKSLAKGFFDIEHAFTAFNLGQFNLKLICVYFRSINLSLSKRWYLSHIVFMGR